MFRNMMGKKKVEEPPPSSKSKSTSRSKSPKRTSSSPNKPTKTGNKPKISRQTNNKLAKSAAVRRGKAKPKPTATTTTKAATSTRQPAGLTAEELDPYLHADPAKWRYSELLFAGDYHGDELGKEETIKGKSIQKAKEKFRKNPKKYVAMMYQASMIDWEPSKQEYSLVYREGTVRFKARGVSPKGWMALLLHEYEALTPFPNDELPKQHCDKYTEQMKWNGRLVHSKSIRPLMPGRGMGVLDVPSLKIIGDVDPSDIHQGFVGDCWLLSGISALAEFDGAVKRLFRKTKNLHKLPYKDGSPNQYTVTLWDLTKWEEVDIVMDERLPAKPDGSGHLLGAKPSIDGELWVCYLEKAMAIHCGGSFDKITGGQCTHAWAVLTGCKHQYTIKINKSTGKWGVFAKYDTDAKQWAKHGNSPHDSDKRMWRVAWPKVGGGGDETVELDNEDLFMKMCAWDDENYIIGAGIRSAAAAGLVDDHAYSVIECLNDVAGTDIDLIKVRNPWGKGEIEDGLFDDDGPGWDQYPQIKKELNPIVADDGIFWVTKQEFFKFFGTIFLSASNMTQFLED